MLIAIHGFTEIDLGWTEVLCDLQVPLKGYLLPGHGYKPCPPNTTYEIVINDLHRRYAEDGPFDLLGYSMGGRVALQFALTYPKLVNRLLLVSCRPGIANDGERAARAEADEGLAMMLEDNDIGQFVAWWENNPALRPARPYSRAMAEHLRSRRLNQDAHGLAACLRALGQGKTPPLWDRLGEITAPTLAIAGSADPRYVADMQRMVDLMPRAQLAVVPECGHAVHRECRDSLLNIVRGFLASSNEPTTNTLPSAQ